MDGNTARQSHDVSPDSLQTDDETICAVLLDCLTSFRHFPSSFLWLVAASAVRYLSSLHGTLVEIDSKERSSNSAKAKRKYLSTISSDPDNGRPVC